VAGADHELDGQCVPSGQAARLVVQPFRPTRARAVASSLRFRLLVPPRQLHEPVSLHRGLPSDGLRGLLIDATQCAAPLVSPVPVTDDLVTALRGRPLWPGL